MSTVVVHRHHVMTIIIVIFCLLQTAQTRASVVPGQQGVAIGGDRAGQQVGERAGGGAGQGNFQDLGVRRSISRLVMQEEGLGIFSFGNVDIRPPYERELPKFT